MIESYSNKISVLASVETSFNAVNNVTLWWTENVKGKSNQINDEFSVHFGEVHYSKQKLIEMVPNQKVIWHVIESRLNWISNTNEWDNTEIIFEISKNGNKTDIHFTHKGLIPEVECYQNCIKGWDYYFGQSLSLLLTTGTGTPEKLISD